MPDTSKAAFWFAMCSDKGKKDVITEVGKLLAKRYHVYREALITAIGITNQAPDDRLAAYQQRPSDTWRLLSEVWPATYAKQTDDWHKLETTVRERQAARNVIAPIAAQGPTAPQSVASATPEAIPA